MYQKKIMKDLIGRGPISIVSRQSSSVGVMRGGGGGTQRTKKTSNMGKS